ncbi:MAG: hypothetical protein AAF412_10585 [Pseudomonadota bacterium]
MTKYLKLIAIAGMTVFAGCNSGTTYGTGSSHEEATLKSMSNMFSIRPDAAPDIDYSARPELVMPSNQQALPAPGAAIEQSDGQDWPVAPEQRIAAIRATAPEPDKYGNLPVEYLQSEKDGIRNSSGLYRAGRNLSRSNDGVKFIDDIKEDSTEDSVSEEVKRRREQLSYSKGVQRKYLTEPPSEYRAPAETAVAGDLGVDSEAVKERIKQQKEERRARDADNIEPRGAL